MKFLVVLRNKESSWGRLFQRSIESRGGQVTVSYNVDEAERLIREDDFSADEIITGSLGSLDEDWKRVQSVASEKDKVFLLSKVHLFYFN